jgi:hypothetical protein
MNKETLEEAAEKYRDYWLETRGLTLTDTFIAGAKFQAERMYSEEEVLELIWKYETRKTSMVGYGNVKKWFDQIKKK